MPLIHRSPVSNGGRAAAVLAAVLLVATVVVAEANTGPFGVGLPEPAATGGGFFPGLFATLAAWQSSFYRALTGAIRDLKTDNLAALWLIGLSFAYGVVHAAGPGHGKAIVSAYVLANRETARNGAILAVVSALAQGVTAVVLVLIAAILLGATSMAMTRAAEVFEIGSFALITALGVVLVWRKLLKPLAASLSARYAPIAVPAGFSAGHGHDHGHDHHDHHAHHRTHNHDHGHDHGHAHGHHHDHQHGPDCGCDHGHIPSPALAAGPLDWRKAWTTVAAVGMRPCTGALIVLVFALSQGLLAAGIAAAFAMALGTGITVAALVLAAVGMRGAAVRVGGASGSTGERVHRSVEALGAVAILLFGLAMLGASLTG